MLFTFQVLSIYAIPLKFKTMNTNRIMSKFNPHSVFKKMQLGRSQMRIFKILLRMLVVHILMFNMVVGFLL